MAITSRSGSSGRAGTQSVERALWLLKEVASANTTGCTMQALVDRVGLNRTTVYRLAKCLLDQGAIQQDSRNKRLFLGPLALALGVAAQQQFDLKQILSSAATRLAEATGDTCFVMLRSGTDAVCIDRRLGSYPVKTLTVEVGTKRPLGIGVGSLAILAALPELEISNVIHANSRILPRYGQSSASLMKAARAAKKFGYVAAPVREIENVIAIGVPVFDRMGKPIAAFSIAAIAERMQLKRRPELLELLRAETKQLHETLCKTNLPGG